MIRVLHVSFSNNTIQYFYEKLKITWTHYGKVKQIDSIINSAATQPKLKFTYDALGNRLMKENVKNKEKEIYIRDAGGNLIALYEIRNDSLFAKEFYMYGSSRLGYIDENIFLAKKNKIIFSSLSNFSTSTQKSITQPIISPQLGKPNQIINYTFGKKRYEINDWLGNVRVVVNDRKTQALQGNTVVGYTAQTLSVSDYYPFGFEIAERSYSLRDYRFGFNRMEKDDEVKGMGNSLDFGSRIFDPRTGKFLSIDPRWRNFPANSPFCYAVNNPVRLIDVDGEGPGDPIFMFGFQTTVALDLTTSAGLFASLTWKQMQPGFDFISMEGGVRGELNVYNKKWGNSGIGVDGSAQAYFGVSVGPNMSPAYRGFVNGGHQFAGSGIGSTSTSGTIGWAQAYLFGTKVNAENINQNIGGLFARADWKSGSVLASHLNDLWGDANDRYDGANAHITYSNFGNGNNWQAGYSFQIVTPQPNVDPNTGRREFSGDYYVTSNSKVNYFQESSLNFQMQTNNGILGGGITSLGKWTQGFWQNHVAHKDGNIEKGGHKMFNNSSPSGFRPGFKLTYSSPFKKD